MIERTIATLLETNLFDHVVVTTDCHETTEISHKAGASRCILRPLHLADDHTPTKPVIQHAIEELKLDLSTAVCCVYPCNPFLKNTTLKKCYDLMIQNHEYFCFPVIEYPHPIQRAFTLDQRSMVTRREPEFVKSRTQDLEPCYHDAGSFYWGTSSMWMSDLEVHEQSLGIPVARTEGSILIRPMIGRSQNYYMKRSTLEGRHDQSFSHNRIQRSRPMNNFISYGKQEISGMIFRLWWTFFSPAT